MTRDEHLQWAKHRALAYLPDVNEAFASMGSDLGKHDGLKNHIGIELGMQMLLAGLMTPDECRRWIVGFN